MTQDSVNGSSDIKKRASMMPAAHVLKYWFREKNRFPTCCTSDKNRYSPDEIGNRAECPRAAIPIPHKKPVCDA
ncbi:MAG: hypothetical protein QHC79_25735 [Pseudosphingobacterium sp.]|nr:hypothetical protein [Pseudosphingobacterium sp.]